MYEATMALPDQTVLEAIPASTRSLDAWAPNVERIEVDESPGGAFAANLDDRMIVSPLQGFGRLWQRTYRVALSGLS